MENPTIKDICREANTMVDFVVKNAVYSFNDLTILNASPQGVYILLMYDLMGHCMSRPINIVWQYISSFLPQKTKNLMREGKSSHLSMTTKRNTLFPNG